MFNADRVSISRFDLIKMERRSLPDQNSLSNTLAILRIEERTKILWKIITQDTKDAIIRMAMTICTTTEAP